MRYWAAVAILGVGLLACEQVVTGDAGTPDAGTFEADTSDGGTPDAGTPDAGTPDAGTRDAGHFAGVFGSPNLVLPPGATGRATVTFPLGAPRTLSAQVTGSAGVTPPTATVGTCVETTSDLSCEVTVATSLETSVETSWVVELSAAPGLASITASLGVVMADDPLMSAQLVTSFKEAVPRQNRLFGADTYLAADGSVAVFTATLPASAGYLISVWRADGGWSEEAAFETGSYSGGEAPLSRDGTRMGLTTLVDAGPVEARVLTRTSAGWETEAVLPGVDYAGWSLSDDGSWLTTATTTSVRVFARDGGTWNESFVGPGGFSAVSGDGSMFATMLLGPPRIVQIYRRIADQWLFETTLTPSLHAGQQSGIWLSRDGSTVMLPLETRPDGGYVLGEVVVFQRTNGLWNEQVVLHPDPGYEIHQFGWDGHLSADGDRLVVGASAEYRPDAGGFANGGVYVFTRHGTSWVRNLRLTSPAGLTGSYFGQSVAASEDGSRFLVGEPGNSTGTPGLNGDLFAPAPQNSGAAFLYRLVGNGS